MSEQANLSKSQRKRRKRAEKRKASTELPETIYRTDQTGQASLDNTSLPSVSQVNVPAYSNILNNSSDYVSAVMNPNISPIMNFSQQIPYGL